MNILPILSRELVGATRRHRTLRTRLVLACSTSFVAMVLIGFEAFGLPVFRQVARYAFGGVALFAVFRSLTLGSAVIASEREEQTLELVFLTGIRPGEFFLGKLAGIFVAVGSEVLACLPLLALPFLIGGLSGASFTASLLWLPLAIVAALSVALLASTLSRDEGSASALAWSLLAGWCLITPLPWFLGQRLSGAVPFDPAWLDLSPARGGWILYTGLTRLETPHFWRSFSVMGGVAGFNLIAASVLLSLLWRRVGHSEPRAAGHPAAHARHLAQRRECLDRQPTEWLGLSQRRPLLHGSLVIGAVLTLWLGCALAWPQGALSTLVLLLVLLFLCCLLDPLEHFVIARQVARDRRAGAFELLLTTPLEPTSLLAGYRQGPIRLLRPLRWAVASFAVLALGLGLLTRTWNPVALILYLLLLALGVAWSLQLGQPHAGWAAVRTGFIVGRSGLGLLPGGSWGSFWSMFHLLRLAQHLKSGRGIPTFPEGTFGEGVVAAIIAFVMVVVVAVKWKRRTKGDPWTPDEIRTLAAEAIPDPSDPRLKSWQPKLPFPPLG